MAVDFKFTESAAVPGGTISGSADVTDGMLIAVDEVVPIGSNVEFGVAFLKNQLKGLVIKSAVACEIETNDGTAFDDKFTMVAGEVITWRASGIHDNPITVDVTSIFITNAAQGRIQFYALIDPTA